MQFQWTSSAYPMPGRSWRGRFTPFATMLGLLILAVGGGLAAQGIGLSSGFVDTSTAPKTTEESLRSFADAKGRALALVQFSGPIQPEWLDAARKAGAEIHHYVPEFAYFMSLAPGHLAALTASKGVRWIGAMTPEMKLHPHISALRNSPGTLSVIILSVEKLPEADLAAQGVVIERSRLTQMGWHDTRAIVPAAQIQAVASVWSVMHIEPQPVYELHGERSAQTAAGNYLPLASAPTGPGYVAWLNSKGLSGAPGVIVQVQDDGIDQGIATNLPGTAHADILGRIAGIFNATSDPAGDSSAGHGQINTGIIIGNATVGTTDPQGYKLGQGLAPQARAYGTKIFRNSGSFDIGSNSFTDLAQDSQDAGVTFSSNSWGASLGGQYNSDSAEFDALARDADPTEPGNQPMIYFFSAGNSGPGAGSVGAPGTAKNVITVGAGENSDADGTDGCIVSPTDSNSIRDLVDFSSRGPNVDSRLGVTLIAVGTHVQGPASTSPSYDGTGVCDMFWPVGQTNYARSSGTSHSCPNACGAGMVVQELFSSQLAFLGHPANPSPALMKAILTNTATSMVGGNNGGGGALPHIPESQQGWGSVNLSTLIDMKYSLYTHDQATQFTGSGQFWEKTLYVADPSKPLKVSLAWTDAPALAGATPALVNDLDLKVTQGATTWRGNVFLSGFSATGGAHDRRNNLEACYIQSASGAYTIRVEAFNIAGDGVPNVGGALDQDFSIFVWNGTDQTSTGTINMDKSLVQCTDQVQVLLSDADLRGAGTHNISMTATSGDLLTVTLVEVAPTAGIFTKEVKLAAGAPVVDGLLQVVSGDTVTATYNDADTGGGSPGVATDTATADCAPPVIYNVNVLNITAGGFTVTFNTDKPAVGSALNSLACGGAGNTLTSPPGLFHTITFTGLNSCTTHYLRLTAVDTAGNTGVNDNGGACFQATTHQVAQPAFTDDFEPSPLAGWTHSAAMGTDNWLARGSASAHSAGTVYSHEPGTGAVADSSLVTPNVPGGGELTFWHTHAFESGYDGGIIEVSTNGGTSWTDLGPEITSGGYNGVIAGFTGNPLAGESVWTGGALGAMTEVRADLSSYPGTLMIRFRLASDNSIASGGWLIDDVDVRGPASGFEPCTLSAGVVTLDLDYYNCGQTLNIEVRDLNAPAGPLSVVISTGGGDAETVMVGDPDGDKTYNGSLLIGSALEPVVLGDARLQGLLTDSIVATYNDADNGSGGPAIATDLAILDCTVPVISNINVIDIGPDTFTVTFDTNEPTTSVVTAGVNCLLGGIVRTGGLATSHAVVISPVAGCSTYFFRIEVADPSGNTAIADNGGVCYPATLTSKVLTHLDDDFEPTDIGGAWSHGGTGTDNWLLRTSPYARSTSHVYSYEPGTGSVADSRLATLNVQGGGELSFWHTYAFEAGFSNYDGGVIEVSTNGGTSYTDLGPQITLGGYTGTISTCCSNPLGGRQAWTGGALGTMKQVKVDLSSFTGQIRIRFRFGSDNLISSGGWLIDDVKVYTIVPTCPPNSVTDWTVFE